MEIETEVTFEGRKGIGIVQRLISLLVGFAIGAVATHAAWRTGTAQRAMRRLRATGDDLSRLTREELYGRAQAAEIPGRSSMSKDDLVQALQGDKT
jgi:hypothetical protein